ncbi:sensor histidine kinase [Campylobacter corcagiensis]|uniref:histidine kinase n=1 Tax=Campylobacter corcagiensis TaxID=1448857 RepID=A0A7M1LGE8_9BACT|nr:HAMP domain-containing sensor histidine kinase [Campylobacter corcagiensis]QKF64301.1 two-component system sensor histidine kinase [Campylobacter corcagiensis]QOQ87510.1 HAMP domain-containing histidine kinase [Campylobacter corcagiensis]
MKNFLKTIFFTIKNLKINKLLFAFTIFLAFTGIFSYFHIKSEISKIGSEFGESLSKEIVFSMNEWLDTRTEFIKTISSSFKNLSKDELIGIEIDKSRVFFQHYQFILDDKSAIFDGKYYDLNNSLNPAKISTCKEHEILKKTTIDICHTIGQNRQFCGVVEANALFPSIRKQIHAFVENAYLFDEDGEILAMLNSANKIPNLNDPRLTKVEKIGNWGTAIEVSNQKILEKTLKILLNNSLILLLLFSALSITSGLIFSFINSTFLKKQKEYEVLLSHKLKVSETGELLSAISHQLRQPINSSLLMLTSIVKLKKDGKLSEDELINNINLCIRSTKMMDETIQNFRNFYKFSDDIVEFELNSSIKNLLSLLHIEFSRKNVSVQVENFEIWLKTSQSYLWQVLLVLLQNSKDALSFKRGLKTITVKAKNLDDIVKISVIDNGIGIEQDMIKGIFNKQKVSTKIHGSGIGLNLAKMIVVKKLGGDIILKSNKNPTIFELTIKKEIV